MSIVEDSSRIAGRFLAARRAAAGLADFPGPLPASLEQAYRIQDEAIAAWNRPVIGWKVGRVPPPLVERFGADRLTGPIFSGTEARGNGSPAMMPVFAEGFAAGEAEFLLRIGREPEPGKTQFSRADAAALIDSVHAGIEVASSPLASINELGPVAVVSDFGNNNGLVIGPRIPDWEASGFEDWEVVTRIDGAEAGHGRAAAFPDGAIGAACFLFELMTERGIALRAGQWISSGAVTGVHPVRPGQRVEAQFGDGPTVICEMLAAGPE